MPAITIQTSTQREIVDITDQVSQQLKGENAACHLFLLHTTAAITIADLDPGTDQDFLDFLEAITPKLKFRHPHDPAHTPAHLLASLIGQSLTVPVRNGKFQLGTWQRIILVELDGPKDRQITTNLL